MLNAALWPAEQLFRIVTGVRNVAYDRSWVRVAQAPIPVVSVGNIAVGGAGKTPFSAWIAGRLAGWGCEPAVVLRGYGGDEILVHRELNPGVPVFVNARRARAVAAAAGAGRRIAVLDDAFQHRALARDLNLLLISVEGWTTVRRLLPRGPWRESASAIRRADVVVLTRKIATDDQLAAAWREAAALGREQAMVECRIAPSGVTRLSSARHADTHLDRFRGAEVLAVAALADPGPFTGHLRAAGAEVELAAYPDHHAFSRSEAEALAERAAGRAIVMTLKDAVKLRGLLAPTVEAYVLHQTVEIGAGADALDRALRTITRVA